MTLSVTHTFVSGIADDPTAAAAGEVLPSHWNAVHTLTGQVDLTTGVTGTLPVGNGGTGTTTGYLPRTVNAQTGTTYTVVASDIGKLVTTSNAAAIAITLPQATGSFGAGSILWIENKGAGTATITPTTSTIDGSATLALTTNQGVTLVSDGTNWTTIRGIGGGGGGTPGGASTQVQYNNSNAFAGDSTFTFDATKKTVKVGAANISAGSIFGTAGYILAQPAGTDTDTAATGTIASTYITTHGARTLAASVATTLTTAATLFVDQPVQGTNVTISNQFSAIFNGYTGINIPSNTAGRQAWAFANAGVTGIKFQRWSDNFGSAVASVFSIDNSVSTDTFNLNTAACVIGSNTFQFSSASMIAANGTVATSITSVGPTGANTTVQEWLKIQNPAGVTRYIPCF